MLYRLVFMLFLSLMVTAEPLKVGVIGGQPFVYQEEGRFNGLSIHYWRSIADKLGLEYTFVPTNLSFDASVRAVHAGHFDVLVGPVSVTYDRHQWVDFSRPYFMNHVGLVLKPTIPAFFDVLFGAFGQSALYLLGIFFLLLLFFSQLFYWAERPYAERFQQGYWRGMGDALWVTLSSFLRDVLYDPVTSSGRLILSVWLILSIVFMSAFTAVVTSTMTVVMTKNHTAIDSKADLIASSVAVRKESAVVSYAKRFGAIPVSFVSMDQAFDKLHKTHVSAIMGDYYALKHQVEMRSKVDERYVMSELNLRNDELAFVFAKGSPLKGLVDSALLEMQDQKSVVARICDQYLGPMNTYSCEF